MTDLDLPALALSIRQPWPWAIVHADKRLENRSQGAVKYMTYRGPICLHASLGMTQAEYNDAADFMQTLGVACPPAHELLRGGIIGTARVVDVIKSSDDPWFFGPHALVLEDVQAVSFIPCSGALGFFRWQRSGASPDAPKKWMLRQAEDLTTPVPAGLPW